MAIPKGATVPEAPSNYFKPEEGKKHKIRILGDAITGWVGFKDKKPFRREGDVCTIEDSEVDYDPKYERYNKDHFWAFPIWNYELAKVQVYEIKQSTVKKALFVLEEAEEWGDLKNYDIQIERKKEGDKTTYNVIALPPRALPEEALHAYEMSDVDMRALFRGEHPIGK